MEVKKSPKADLEGKKSTWLLIGYVFILALMFVAFEWTDRDKQVTTETGITDVVFEEEIIPITEQEQKQAPPPPEAPKVEEVLQIVENDAKVEETTIQASEETGQAVEVKYVPVEVEEEIIPITEQEQKQAPPPPEAPKVEEVLQIVENDAKVEETAIQASEETGQAVEVKYVPVEVEEEEPEEQQIFQVVEEMPEFPGGMAECLKFLGKNIKYPTISQENGVQGKVIVQFVVNKDGSIVDPVVVRSVDPYLDKEALRVIKTMPKWKPGKQRGKAVRVKYTVPVTFKLQ